MKHTCFSCKKDLHDSEGFWLAVHRWLCWTCYGHGKDGRLVI